MRADAVAYWFGRVLCAEFVRRDAAAGLFGTILALSIPAQIKCFFAQVRWEPASEAAFGFHRALRCHCRSARSSHTYGVSSGRHPQPASENTRTSACRHLLLHRAVSSTGAACLTAALARPCPAVPAVPPELGGVLWKLAATSAIRLGRAACADPAVDAAHALEPVH